MARSRTRNEIAKPSVEESSLLAAIYANPEEDLPRCAYADWCGENDKTELAEFISEELREGSTHLLGKTPLLNHRTIMPCAAIQKMDGYKSVFSTARGFIERWDVSDLAESIRYLELIVDLTPTLTIVSFPKEPAIETSVDCFRLLGETQRNWTLSSLVVQMGYGDDPLWLAIMRTRWPRVNWWGVNGNVGPLVFHKGGNLFKRDQQERRETPPPNEEG